MAPTTNRITPISNILIFCRSELRLVTRLELVSVNSQLWRTAQHKLTVYTQDQLYRVAQSRLTHFITHSCPKKWAKGQSLHTDKQIMPCCLKTCSKTRNRWSIYRVSEHQKNILCNVSSVACTVAGPHGPGLLFMWIPARQRIQESPTHITQEMKRALGDEIVNVNQEPWGRVFWQFCEFFKTTRCEWMRTPSRSSLCINSSK